MSIGNSKKSRGLTMEFTNDLVRSLVPYVPGEQPQDKQYIKLNTNESPYGPSPLVDALITGVVRNHETAKSAYAPADWEAVGKARDYVFGEHGENLRLYPDPTVQDLKKALADRYGLKESSIFIGNGSDEVLALSFMAFTSQELPLTFADNTYSFYPVWADLFKTPYQTVPLIDGITYDLEGCYAKSPAGPVILCNPNAPTGTVLPISCIRKALTEHPDRLLLVDEAYVDFGAESAVSLIPEFPNLLVVQTFSKSRSLAGIRVGYAMGQEKLITALETVKNSFNSYTISRFSLKAACLSLKDENYFRFVTGEIQRVRDLSISRLRKLGFIVTDSKTNFLWVTHPAVSGEEIYRQLKDRGILVRHFSKEALQAYNRITVGTEDQMNHLVAALQEIVS